jgi:hypothetical protein
MHANARKDVRKCVQYAQMHANAAAAEGAAAAAAEGAAAAAALCCNVNSFGDSILAACG